MTAVTTWDDLAARLTDLLGRLPEHTVLELHEVRHSAEGWSVRLRQYADRIGAEFAGHPVLDPDRRLGPGQESALAGLGWHRPGGEHPDHWWAELAWPAPAAGYQGMAVRVVATLRDVLGLGAPDRLAYQHRVAGVAEPLPGLGVEELAIGYHARVGPGESARRPRGLVRRVRIGTIERDEALGRDGRWRPTETLELFELGELDDDLVPLTSDEAEEVIAWWRRLAARPPRDSGTVPAAGGGGLRLAAAVDAERDAAGGPVVRGPRLADQERPAVVAYLRDAPLVAVTYGFDPDPFQPDRPEVVPLHLHTDGSWVWSESLAYFAERYGIAPEPDFLRHMAQRGYRAPEVDQETLGRAVALVRG